ncbi:mismatch repair endonuclease PMS2 isoform X1 [Pararge aegeria]|uniref:Jg16704 protein n=4 Tax=Pararge aegeria TaxID=116150 RepID=A0A8S4RLZ6_9NEOP|nr:mismatch repair endonuclease PMS2 isoform X1 [Pararge aegeria]CAH2237901.1 jg16704 [Pararge aegeria aegeria]
MVDVNDLSDVEISSIKPINKDSVHKICSGQVVLSLAVAVKELVENSLDAGATNIDIRLKNYGLDLLEVSDNGSGVTEDNFAALTLKYHTSKLSDYSDLLGVSSFGFRGEALSSLCSLANLTITTRHHKSEYATKIEYDHKGNITNKKPCSRQVGTTVTLSNLFCSLPVRQKEFQKNAKREFNKMTNLLYAYCLIATGVRITCSNQTSSNVKSVVVATQGSLSYKDNIACIFGIKQLQSILELKTECMSNIKDNILRGLSGEVKENEDSVNIEEVEIDLSEDSNDADNIINNSQESITSSQKSQGYKNIPEPVKVTGFISSCAHGSGRSSTDRQFFYVNSRPCEPIKVIKLINEIYRQFNPHQYPFVFLNVNVDRVSVDVNVTPDKRKLFLTKEKSILDVLKHSLLKIFENIPKTLRVEPTVTINNQKVEPELSQPRIFQSFIKQFSNQSDLSMKFDDEHHEKADLKRKSNSNLGSFTAIKKTYTSNIIDKVKPEPDVIDDDDTETQLINKNSERISNIEIIKNADNFLPNKSSATEVLGAQRDIIYLENTDELPNTQIRNITDVVFEKSHTIRCKPKDIQLKTPNLQKVVTDKEELGKNNRKTVNMKTSLAHVKALVDIFNNKKDKYQPDRIKFRSAINPVFNKKCEEELSREISKDSFKRMDVVGQFNLGFIITRLDDDLFIIDQHATDEIYNFESLQKTTELTNQKLVIPQNLELTGVNEQILMDNLAIFKKNGFTFIIDEHAPPTKRVKLLTIPMSKNWMFGKEDIDELLFMLRENQSEYCRPSRVRAMFASRACRKSVMIGTALSKADMRILVDHMAEIDKPWNCPHGRPTIRHLVNLAMVQTSESGT